MNQCKYCGKGIPEGRNRKFCNHSCSAAYNNVHRTRKPWTEEQKKAFSRKQIVANGHDPDAKKYCKYCGKEIISGTSCSECVPYVHYVNTFTKLKIEGKTLFEKYNTLSQKVEKLYFEDRKSLPEISKETGLWYLQIERLLWNSGNSLRSLSDSQKLSLLHSKSLPGFNPKYRHGWYTTWEGKKIFYRSSYELEYALYLDEQQISYDVEDLRIEYFDTQKNEMRVAIPDFHLLDTNGIVEIKSSWTYDEQLMKDKFKAYKASGYIPKLILDKKEIELV